MFLNNFTIEWRFIWDNIQIYNIYLPIIKEKLSKFEEILLIFNETDASSDGELAALEYDKEIHDMMIQNNMIDEAKEKGIETGKKIGIDERNLEIAKNMLKKKLDINTISECTGLSLEEIQNL